MPAKPYSYSTECERLARQVLAEEADVPETAIAELAQQIQETVEDFIQFDLPTLKETRNAV